MSRALFLAITLAAGTVAAQDDDLPALPTAPRPKAKAAPKAKPKAQPKKPAVVDDDLPSLPVQKGDLVVKLSNPLKGAKLTIDDKEIGLLPQPAQSLSPGEHTVSVRRLGFTPYLKKVNVTPGKTNDVSVTLEASTAVLTVSSDVMGAQVFVNGRLAGNAPLVDLEVPPGNLEITVKKDGYHDATQMLPTKAGRDYPVEVKLGAPIAAAVSLKDDTPRKADLTSPPIVPSDDVGTATATYDPSPPVYKRWWFWTGVGIVVIGIVVASFVVVNNQKSSQPVPLGATDFGCYPCEGYINVMNALITSP